MDEKEFLRLSNDENLICESQTIESNNSVVFFLCSKLGGQNGKDKKPHLKQFNI